MKKLLVILMAVVGMNAYAGWDITNSTSRYLAAKCFPSGTICNGISPANDCSCPNMDDVMYFGRTSMSDSTTPDELDAITVFTASNSQTWTNYHNMGDGNVWKIPVGSNRSNSFSVEGDPNRTIDCEF